MTLSPIPALDAIQEPPPAVADALNAYFDAIGVTTKIPTVLAWDVWNICANADRANHTARADVAEGYVLVPKSALHWLFGEDRDAAGNWFGQIEEQVEPLASLNGNKPRYWWRTHFRKLIAAAPSQGDSA